MFSSLNYYKCFNLFVNFKFYNCYLGKKPRFNNNNSNNNNNNKNNNNNIIIIIVIIIIIIIIN